MKFTAALLNIALFVAAGAVFAQVESPSRGEYIARLGNCVACHTVENGAPFAGGLKMRAPLIKSIYTTNITPDPQTGIGNYSLEDFDRAVRLGVTRDGHNLFAAMPYPSFAKMTKQDVADLYDYFMNDVAPVNQSNLPNEMPFRRSLRWPALALWNLFALDENRYEADPDQDEAWNRGAYLVQGPGHCGACHTPRGAMLKEKGLDETDPDFLAGAELDHWYASALNGDPNAGLGRWSEDDIVAYLKTGKNRFGKAFGTMVEVVNNSTAYMTDEDLKAIAVYLKSLPAVNEEGVAEYRYDSGTAEKLANSDFSDTGALIYRQKCMQCHGKDGAGKGAHIPPLAGNPVIVDPDPSSLINVTLNGSLRVVLRGHPEPYDMPVYRVLLDDQEIADVISFIRNAWGNSASNVSIEAVATIRQGTDPDVIGDVVVLRMK